MSIDPRLMKQLLMLQLQPGDPLSLRTPSSDSSNGFSQLLETLLAQSNAASMPVADGSVSGTRSSTVGIPRVGSSSFPFANSTAFDPLVMESSSRHGVDPALIKAVIHTESSFNPYAVSAAGAKGLMQLMDGTAKQVGVSDPFDPSQSIDGGTGYLAGLLRKYGNNEAVALAAYNAGPSRIDRLGIRTDADLYDQMHLLPSETQQYVEKVLRRKQEYA